MATSLEKQYWLAGMIAGAYHLIGGIPRGLVLVAEGYATAASLFEATQIPVAAAFDAGSIMRVVAHSPKARQKDPICADDDYLTPAIPAPGSPLAASALHGAAWIKPEFAEERPTTKKGATDFNDLHALEGIHVARSVNVHLASLAGPSSGGRHARGRETASRGETIQPGQRLHASRTIRLDLRWKRHTVRSPGTHAGCRSPTCSISFLTTAGGMEAAAGRPPGRPPV